MEAIPIFAVFGVFCASSLIVGCAIYRLVRYRKISTTLGVLAAIASFPLAAITITRVNEGDTEYNPSIRSSEQLIGTYSSGNHTIVLRADGTYSSIGIAELTSGDWSNHDWNLQLSNSSLREPRIITRNDVLCIAPFYDGVDAPLGTLLKKEGDSPGLTAKDLLQFTPISEGVRRASSLTLYEGLPHQGWEADQLKKELATKKTVRFHDFPFYERPLKLAADEVEPLRRLSAAGSSYTTYGGPKRCGGYHPDYCLTWKDGEVAYQLLICFGCDEMKLYGPKSELLVDINREAMKAFEAALKKHRDQRP